MKHCMECFFFRINEEKHEICSRGKDLEKKKWNFAEKCPDYRDDKTFTRLRYPIGVTPEEEKEKRRAAVLAALEGVEDGNTMETV